jgi:hypothetical protein
MLIIECRVLIRPSFEAIVKSLTAYHKNLKKIMSFTSDSVGDSDEEMNESSSSEDELGTQPSRHQSAHSDLTRVWPTIQKHSRAKTEAILGHDA